jgi:hypothetical protein
MAKSGEDEHQPSAQHPKTKIQDVDAKLERAAGQDLGEPDHPADRRRPPRRAGHRQRGRHVHDQERHAEHGDHEVGELVVPLLHVVVAVARAAAEAAPQVGRREEAVGDADEDGRPRRAAVADRLPAGDAWLEEVQRHGPVRAKRKRGRGEGTEEE